MFCKYCGAQVEEGAPFCGGCGKATAEPVAIQTSAPELPEQNRPLSPWAYFGLSLLFSIPVVGFVFLIVFSFNGSNINRRNYARSYWCGLLIAAIILAIVAIIGIAGGNVLNEISRF